MPKPRDITHAVKAVRPLPEVAHRVLRMVQEPDWDIARLVEIVRTEPTLVARILRLCNSAGIGLEREIASIGDAISYVGSRTLVQLVLVTCSAGMFRGIRGSCYADPTTTWHHAVACALASQAVATRTGAVPPANAFTAGILHDVGKIVIADSLSEADVVAALDCADSTHPADHAALERMVFGIDHAEAASVVAAAWKLPEWLTHALRAHHDRTLLGGDAAMPAVLHVADQLALQAGIGNPFPRVPADVDEAAMERLELGPDDLEDLSQRLHADVSAAADLLNLEPAPGR
ncbi:MAG: HDOD domain-containing protein [Planctomycetes bacterium]|nr:HDOD domain-containing protein [Planctomycetota bacterium]